MENRIQSSKTLLADNGVLNAIDDNELESLGLLLKILFKIKTLHVYQ